MERQRDWFTGINYNSNYGESEITLEEKTISQPIKVELHEKVQLIYIKGGSGRLQINGMDYPASEGCFFCLYSHHFYSIPDIRKPIHIVSVEFYIGLFMYMCWEKHPRNAHDQLVYDTCPMVCLKGEDRTMVEELLGRVKREQEEKRFEYKNLIAYMTLTLHGYHCRFAFEGIGIRKEEKQRIWQIIERAILCTEDTLSLEEIARQEGEPGKKLNYKIKEACGRTFFQLQQYGRILNACALLHFPELSMEYISHLLNFSSVQSFYRVFRQYTGKTPRGYQSGFIMEENMVKTKAGLGLGFLQYMHLHFMRDIGIPDLSQAFYLKDYTVKQIIWENFGKDVKELLKEIRISYACSFLATTEYTILEIANLCGFNSLSTFQRAFIQYQNQTPREYRDESRQK